MFRQGNSTINQLVSIVHTISKALDCNPTLEVRSVHLDISKASGRVWHEGFILKLRHCGVAGQLLVSLRFATRMMKTTHGGLGTNVAEAF